MSGTHDNETALNLTEASGTTNSGSQLLQTAMVATPNSASIPAGSAVRPMEIAESIKTLHEIHQSGGLTTQEFQQAKQAILESTTSSATQSMHSPANSRVSQPRSQAKKKKKKKRHHKGSHSSSSRSSSRSSRSSSSSSSDQFIIVPRAKLWKNLQKEDDESFDHTSNGADATVEIQSPLYPSHGSPSPNGSDAPLLEKHDHSNSAGGTTSFSSLSQREKKYGTIGNLLGLQGSTVGMGHRRHISQLPDHEVNVQYFNCCGKSSSRFADVILQPEQLRNPVVMQKRAHTSKPKHSPLHLSESQHFEELPPEEQIIWEEFTDTTSSSNSSVVVQSLNWYWIDVTGRDHSRKKYNGALRYLTKKFNLCESFLIDRDHVLMLPQMCESPNFPGQYLLNIRVATDKISIVDDSVMELTNRWIIIIDLNQSLIITLHRMDTYSMASLRTQWESVMKDSDVSFQEFLLKIIDDAIHTYELSLDVHADLLDKCESKLFTEAHNQGSSNRGEPPSATGRRMDIRILNHFSGSSRSPFLRKLLDREDKTPVDKSQMNSFLHHLHRRTSVQQRMLNLNQVVLNKSFTKLRLCSKELANQLCGACIELSDRAMEIRDDSQTLLDLHIALQSFRTNELMAVLTKVSMFFTPCTFLAGVYGMNFSNMPEIHWNYGYLMFWLLCLLLVTIMQLKFRGM
ncbi:CorA-like Mg2+ transporter protein, putative [Angomonas deanei]|uniref:CorA-like Mg2+ transporter protein, putative n=1 Tax=Angomonas deanei TaxID=59799 RepID=A0A7G2CSG2_9TRYP|nr:CorA-like Mg2+ transporter protein, putative [Angomonas deanei]